MINPLCRAPVAFQGFLAQMRVYSMASGFWQRLLSSSKESILDGRIILRVSVELHAKRGYRLSVEKSEERCARSSELGTVEAVVFSEY